ncbi:MAG: SMP-30/gluconolactonase/LRE family protein [Pseudomonadota bacterium]
MSALGKNPILEFQVDPSEIRYIGKDLQRPECILAEPDGTLWTADARGGVVMIRPDGEQRFIKKIYDPDAKVGADGVIPSAEGSLPNGMTFAENGDILMTDFGSDVLEVMSRDGRTRLLYDSIDGKPFGKVNFLLRDSHNRIYLSISTRMKKYMKAFSPNPDIADGYIVLMDDNSIRIVADGFRWTNEIRLDAREEYLYVVETAGKRVSRMRVAPDGSLSHREVYGPPTFHSPGFPDGMAFDSTGNLWGTMVMSDQIFVLTPEGDFHIVLDDGDKEASRALEEAFIADRLIPEVVMATGGTMARWFSSVTFGGPDLKTVYIGSLMGNRIPYFRSPVSGLPLIHWSSVSR